MESVAEQLVKQFVVGKAVAFLQFTDTQVGHQKIPVQTGEPVIVEVLEPGSPHVFTEKAAEIFRLQGSDSGGVSQCDLRAVILMGVIEHCVQAGQNPGTFRLIISRHLPEEIPV